MFFKRIENFFSIIHVKNWYLRYERPISSLFLVGGFVFDAVTLKRVDMFWENFWIVAHLVGVALCILLINYFENKVTQANEEQEKLHFWLINSMQFLFGGLLSTYLVFYFRSATLAVAWPFIVVLIAAFVANESLKKHYTRISFQISLLYLSLFLFCIFLLPVIFHTIGTTIFLVSGALSLCLIAGFFLLIIRVTKKRERSSIRNAVAVTVGIFVLMNVLYFTHLIPPIPLSLKDAGVYHSIEKDGKGNYVVAYEATGWRSYFHFYEDFHLTSGSAAYVYSAIFSPTAFTLDIVHEWQYYDEDLGAWITENIITLPVLGGRDGGYRTYSIKSNLIPGRWRVNVSTISGNVIGRVGFTVIPSDTEPKLITESK